MEKKAWSFQVPPDGRCPGANNGANCSLSIHVSALACSSTIKKWKIPPHPHPPKKIERKENYFFATRILRNGVLVFFYTNIVRLHLYSNLHDVVFNILIQFPIAFQSLEAERQMQRYSTHT